MHIQKPFATLRPTLPILFRFFLFASIMCISACSSDNDNKGVQTNYIVQAAVSVEDDGPVAIASVMDGDNNLVSTLNLIINGEPMSVEYSGANGESTETGDGYPYYTMDLSYLKGGDMVVFEARDQFGAIVYAPEPAVIPMAVELLEPEEGQELVAGDEVRIRWAGGEAEGVVYGAGFESFDGESRYFKDTAQSQELTVPVGQTKQGSAIVGAGATTGQTQLLSLTLDELMQTSYFYVSAATAINVTVSGGGARHPMPSSVPSGCPDRGYHNSVRAQVHCNAEMFLTLGISISIWNNRIIYDQKHGCDFGLNGMNPLCYCSDWRERFAPMAWVGCCDCDKPACPG
jgi:hypothetical protein